MRSECTGRGEPKIVKLPDRLSGSIVKGAQYCCESIIQRFNRLRRQLVPMITRSHISVRRFAFVGAILVTILVRQTCNKLCVRFCCRIDVHGSQTVVKPTRKVRYHRLVLDECERSRPKLHQRIEPTQQWILADLRLTQNVFINGKPLNQSSPIEILLRPTFDGMAPADAEFYQEPKTKTVQFQNVEPDTKRSCDPLNRLATDDLQAGCGSSKLERGPANRDPQRTCTETSSPTCAARERSKQTSSH